MRALVTGASSGIGAEIARLLSEKGYEIILVARREDRLLEVQKNLKTKSRIFVADLGKMEDLENLVTAFPDVDILVNNAGLGVYGEFTQTDFHKENLMIDVNIRALHFLMKKYIPLMKNGGKILNIASSAAFCSGPLLSSYYASKAYVLRLSNGVREELRRNKIPVSITVFCPGPVETEFGEVSGSDLGAGIITAECAAKKAVSGMLKGKKTVVPTLTMKFTRVLAKLLPDTLLVKIMYGIQKNKRR